jgi:hypothetical protein
MKTFRTGDALLPTERLEQERSQQNADFLALIQDCHKLSDALLQSLEHWCCLKNEIEKRKQENFTILKSTRWAVECVLSPLISVLDQCMALHRKVSELFDATQFPLPDCEFNTVQNDDLKIAFQNAATQAWRIIFTINAVASAHLEDAPHFFKQNGVPISVNCLHASVSMSLLNGYGLIPVSPYCPSSTNDTNN